MGKSLRRKTDIPKLQTGYIEGESDLSQDLKAVVKREADSIEKEAKVTYDGKQYLVRIPNEISKAMSITIKDYFRFNLTIPLPDANQKPQLKISLARD